MLNTVIGLGDIPVNKTEIILKKLIFSCLCTCSWAVKQGIKILF